MSTKEGSSVRLANQARNAAVRALIAMHSADYNEILVRERMGRGLPPSNNFASQIKKAENLRDRMRDMGLDTTSIDAQIDKMVGAGS